MLSKKILVGTDELAIAVSRYAPGERHRPHRDQHSRISFLLSGAYDEQSQRAAIRMQAGDVLLKSHRAKHEDQFGPSGAVLAAIEFLSDDPFERCSNPALWRCCNHPHALRHAILILEAGVHAQPEVARVASCDLLAAAEQPLRGHVAPQWLARLKSELEDLSLAHVNVAKRAQAGGVHLAQASRLFRRCFGASITEHAQWHSVRRALVNLGEQNALSDLALAVGFYDQSHMNRVFRRVTGKTPGQYRALLNSASVPGGSAVLASTLE